MSPRRQRPIATASLAGLLLLAGVAAPADAARPARVFVVSCDGAGAQMLASAVARGTMPRLAALAAQGAVAGAARASFATRTAAGHASLWTGAFADVNGVGANMVPPAGRRSALDGTNGFLAGALNAEPIFATAARAGKRVLAYNLAQSTPFEAFAPGGRFGAGIDGRLALVNGYAALEPEGVWDAQTGAGPADAWRDLPASATAPRELVGTVAGVPLYALLYDDPGNQRRGYDTCLIAAERSGARPLARLAPAAADVDGAWSAPVTIAGPRGRFTTYFRLFALAPNADRVVLYHTAPARREANAAGRAVVEGLAEGAFVEGSAMEAYGWGRLGRTLADGGDGEAERRYLATVRFALARQRADLEQLLRRPDWELLMAYTPLPDEAAHLWWGYFQPGTPTYDRANAPRLREAFDRVLGELDAYLGALRAALPGDAAMLVVADHGMAPARWDFRPNVALRRAGLLALDADGAIDLGRTRVLYPPHDGAYMLVNTTDLAGGIVAPDQVPAVLAEARRALEAITVKTPAGLVPVVRTWLAPGEPAAADLGVGGVAGGHLYLDLQPGYDFDPEPGGDALFVGRHPNASGSHGFDARRPELHAAFYAAGAGIKRGVRLGTVRTSDVAPTIAALLGIAPPPRATGAALGAALDF